MSLNEGNTEKEAVKFQSTNHMEVAKHPSYPTFQPKTGQEIHQNTQSTQGMEA